MDRVEHLPYVKSISSFLLFSIVEKLQKNQEDPQANFEDRTANLQTRGKQNAEKLSASKDCSRWETIRKAASATFRERVPRSTSYAETHSRMCARRARGRAALASPESFRAQEGP
ncbi:hypothetical protein R6Z07M_015885 [Ovis aries]